MLTMGQADFADGSSLMGKPETVTMLYARSYRDPSSPGGETQFMMGNRAP